MMDDTERTKKEDKALTFLQKGRSDLTDAEPWVGYGSYYLEFTSDWSIPTLCTDGERLMYNPDYVLSIRTDDFASIYWAISEVEHEAWHPSLGHCALDWSKERDADGDLYDPILSNTAQDYVINHLIGSAGRRVHPTWINGTDDPNRGKFDGQPWTEIYMTLKKMKKAGQKVKLTRCRVKVQPPAGSAPVEKGKDGKEGGPKGGNASKPDPSAPPSPPSKGPATPGAEGPPEPRRNDWDIIIQEATEFAKGRGQLPGGVERLARKVAQRDIDWKPVLARHMSRMKKGDYSYRKPNKTYFHTGLVFPVCTTWTAEPLLVIDTSGSCWQQISGFMHHVFVIARTARVPLWIVSTDTKVYTPFQIKRPGDWKKYTAQGCGGTDFVPFFDWMERRKRPDLVIFFTDGDARFPDYKPGYPVVWCLLDGANRRREGYVPPFGTIIDLPKDLKV